MGSMSPVVVITERRTRFTRCVDRFAMATQNTIASVSVDLDALWCYWRIHALPGQPPEDTRHAILRRCLPRFAALFGTAGIKATFFVVGRDLVDDAEGRKLLADLAADGHELANHSFTHPYNLVRLPRTEIADEIDRAHDAVGSCGRHAPVGFRAPGYEISADVIDLLCDRSYRYDSSTFPSIPYYGAKAVVMAAMRVLGRPSGSTLGTPRVLTAPTDPYTPASGQPYRRGKLPIWELPIAVSPRLRLPVFGTSLITAPEWLRRRLVASAMRQRFFNLELHGIDLADAQDDGIPASLVARQPDLRRPLAAKLAALGSTLAEIRGAGGTFRTLADAAAEMAH
jgi:peptidoglycan/xylan/chitin deacetylase (PgdA/CDA1 family)